MKLTPRQRRSLDAICDTFCPSEDGLPSATEMGVPDAVLGFVARDPRRGPRRELSQLLSLWDSAPLTALGGGGLKRFSALAREQREQVLLSWCDSRLPQRRAAFQALRKAVAAAYYGLPGRDGGKNPVWDQLGYPGPPGPPQDAPPSSSSRWRSARARRSTATSASSARARAAASPPRAGEAGLDVVVLEARRLLRRRRLRRRRADVVREALQRRAGRDARPVASASSPAACLGGGTVVNYTTSFRTPDDVRAEWAAHGVPAFASDEYTASLDAVYVRLGVNQEHNDAVHARAAAARRLHRARLARRRDAAQRHGGCDQGEDCGCCGFGCRRGAKQSTVEDLAAGRAARAGAHRSSATRVERVHRSWTARRAASRRSPTAGTGCTVRSRAVVAPAARCTRRRCCSARA